MKQKTGRKLLSVLLALALVLGLLPGMGLTAYAADGQSTVTWHGAELPTSACTANGIEITGTVDGHDWYWDTSFSAPSGMVFTGISISHHEYHGGPAITWNWTGRATEVSIGETIYEVSNATFTLERNTVAVTGVNLNPTYATLTVGDTDTLTATVAPDNATDKTVAWESSDTNVATVENGVVTAVAAGTAFITATSNADITKSASCAVTVTTAPGTQYNPWQIGRPENKDNVTAWLSGDGDALTLNISGTGDMQDFADYDAVPWAGSKAVIQTVTIGAGVTSIGNYAFNCCYNLTSVTIPNTVTSIGESAFESCGKLTSVELPSGVTVIKPNAFMSCESLTSVTIPGTVTVIGEGAFVWCFNLNIVTFTPGTAEATLTFGQEPFYDAPATLAYGEGTNVLYDGDNMVAAETPMSTLGGMTLTWKAAPTDSETPLTLEAKTNGTILVQEPKDGMQYSLNGGERHAVPDEAITVTAGDTVAFYGSATSYSGTVISGGTAQCYIYGNIMSLINATDFASVTALGAYAFAHFFEGNARLFSHPDKKLVLPATTLEKNCYDSMFRGCTGLTTAPALPATTLAERCYAYMFCECTGLTTAPELPATTLAKRCYTNMFSGCTKLNAVTCLAKDISAEKATDNWLGGVAKTGTFTKNPDMKNWATNSASGIPTGWTVKDYSTTPVPAAVETAPEANDLTYNGKPQALTTAGAAAEGTMQYATGTDTAPTGRWGATLATATDAGTYHVWYRAYVDEQNYSTPTDVTVEIKKADITPTVSIEGWVYGENAKQPSVSGNTSGAAVTYTYAAKGSDDFKTATPTDAGEYTVKATVAATGNYNGNTATVDFTITKANITPTVSIEGWAYGENAKQPSVSGNTSGGTVTYTYAAKGSDDFKTATPTDAGEYTVKATVAATGNYNGNTATVDFTITKANITPTVSIDNWVYGENAKQPSVSGNTSGAAVTYTYAAKGSDDFKTATPTDAGEYTVKATVAAIGNYNGNTATVDFTITKANITPTVSMKNWTEGSRASEPVLEGNPGQGDVTFTYAKQGKDDFTDKKPTSAGRYIVKATVAETANYNGGETTAEFTINADDSADLTVTSPLTSVSRVTINGRVVSPANYTVSGGSVYFTESFLASLKPGTYTIKVTDGATTATATYRVENGGIVGSVVLSATTGDPGVVPYGLLAVSSTLGLAWMGKKRKED